MFTQFNSNSQVKESKIKNFSLGSFLGKLFAAELL